MYLEIDINDTVEIVVDLTRILRNQNSDAVELWDAEIALGGNLREVGVDGLHALHRGRARLFELGGHENCVAFFFFYELWYCSSHTFEIEDSLAVVCEGEDEEVVDGEVLENRRDPLLELGFASGKGVEVDRVAEEAAEEVNQKHDFLRGE